ncbi:MAG: serine protease [Rubrobacteraceae bacterium]
MTRKLDRHDLWLVLAAASIAALVCLCVFLRSGSVEAREGSGEMEVREFQTDVEWPDPGDTTRETQIVGGRPVPNGKYDFVAFVQIRNSQGAFGRCGGTLIDRNSVLTAAHCLAHASSVRVIVGRTDIRSDSGQARDAVKGFIHPRYTGNNFAHDAAVVKLESPVRGIRPVRLSTPRQNALERPGRRATAAGWGTTREGGVPTDRMREVRLPIRSDTQAKRAYDRTGDSSLKYFPRLMVAAGAAGKDACQGDSGGPLFTRAGKVYTQIGVTSYGQGCARKGFPGVWTEVNAKGVRSFIANAAKK